MDYLASVTRNVIAPMWALWEKSPYLQHYSGLLATQYDPPKVIHDRQIQAVSELMGHAYKTVPFWKKRIDASGIKSDTVSSLDELQLLPLLTKSDLREQGKRLVAPGYPLAELYEHTTSGATGVSVVTYSDEACQQFKRGATLRSDEWSGWRLGERRASIWGNPQIRKDWQGRVRRALLERDYVYLDTLKMSIESMDAFANVLVCQEPSMIFGHAHSLYLFASYLQLSRPDVHIRPNAVLSTCMVLHSFERECIEEVFACSVTNRYGCEEVSLIACECEAGEGLHVNAECLHVEIIDKHGHSCPPGVPGRVVVTDLKNRAMPLIRYEVGDMAVWADTLCSCGRTLPLLSRIEGRVADYVLTADGSLISGISLTENFAVKVPGVEQVQIIQHDIDRFTFNLVKGSDFGNTTLRIIGELVVQHFGETAQYTCRYMDTIPPEESGKYRFCISHVDTSRYLRHS